MRLPKFLRVVLQVDNDPIGDHMLTWRFWRETLERAVKTAGQSGLLAVGAAEGFNLFALDFATFGGFVAGGAFLSVLTSLATIKVGAEDSPSAIL
jgi:hypothetical protein